MYKEPFDVADLIWAMTTMGLGGLRLLQYPKLLADLKVSIEQPENQNLWAAQPDRIPPQARSEQRSPRKAQERASGCQRRKGLLLL